MYGADPIGHIVAEETAGRFEVKHEIESRRTIADVEGTGFSLRAIECPVRGYRYAEAFLYDGDGGTANIGNQDFLLDNLARANNRLNGDLCAALYLSHNATMAVFAVLISARSERLKRFVDPSDAVCAACENREYLAVRRDDGTDAIERCDLCSDLTDDEAWQKAIEDRAMGVA